jgi:hypothetical protein
MAVGRLPKIALKWMPKRRRARGRPKKNWMEGIRKAMHERNQMKASGKTGSNGVEVSDSVEKRFETDIHTYQPTESCDETQCVWQCWKLILK